MTVEQKHNSPLIPRLAGKASVLLGCAASLIGLATGCSMCCGPHDYEYPMFQSRYARMDPEHGRVGSIFTDPGVGPGTAPRSNADLPAEELPANRDDNTDSGPDDPDFNRRVDPFRGEEPDDQDTATSASYSLSPDGGF